MVINFSSQFDLFRVKFAWFKYIIGKFVKEVFLDHFGSPQTTTEIKIRPTNTELGIESSLNFEMKCQKFFSERVIQFAINYLCFGI